MHIKQCTLLAHTHHTLISTYVYVDTSGTPRCSITQTAGLTIYIQKNNNNNNNNGIASSPLVRSVNESTARWCWCGGGKYIYIYIYSCCCIIVCIHVDCGMPISSPCGAGFSLATASHRDPAMVYIYMSAGDVYRNRRQQKKPVSTIHIF